jgi:hypothetical protein
MVADADGYVFQDNESIIVLEGLSLHDSGRHCPCAILTSIPIHDVGSSNFSDLVNGDDQIPIAPCEATYRPNRRYSVHGHSFDYILGSPGIAFIDPRNLPTQNSVLKVGDIQTVLSHLFHRMRIAGIGSAV